ncbi:hypothetical protein GQ457_18G019870 [Hibiscus cannabinus]
MYFPEFHNPSFLSLPSPTPSIEKEPTHLKLFEPSVKTYNECSFAPFILGLLVKSCLQMKRLDGSIEIVRMSKSRGISPQVSICNALISEFLE